MVSFKLLLKLFYGLALYDIANWGLNLKYRRYFKSEAGVVCFKNNLTNWREIQKDISAEMTFLF